MTHRLTIQFDARLSFELNLPPDDARLVRERTPLRVVVEAADDRDDCSKFTLTLRVGEGAAAEDYEQASFVHRSAADGAAACLLQYLASKPSLNVVPGVAGASVAAMGGSHHPSYVAVGWELSKGDARHPVATHAERLPHR